MYSQKQQQEFYELIEQRKREIQGLNISEDRKNNLYDLVDETIQRFEQNKTTYLNSQKSLAHLKETEKKLDKDFETLKTNIKILSFNLETIVEISKINKDSSQIKKRVLH